MDKLLGFLLWVGVLCAPFGAWITHIVYCLKTGAYLLLIAGGIIAPIGMIHGWGLWLGAW